MVNVIATLTRADKIMCACEAFVGIYILRQIGEDTSFFVCLLLLTFGGVGTYITWQKLQYQFLQLSTRKKTCINIGFREKFKENFVFLKAENNTSKTNDIGDDTDKGSARRMAEESIKRYIRECGLKPYMFSCSTTRPIDTIDCHLIYSHCDMHVPYRRKPIENSHVLCMMDVNSGFDLEQWLWNGRPIILYSFFPTKVCGDCSDGGKFSIKNNIITTMNKKGKQYQHQAYNFNEDYFVIEGILSTLMVSVDQFIDPNDKDRRVVCLTPAVWYSSAFKWFSTQEPNKLQRMLYQCDNANILVTPVEDDKGELVLYVSIGLIDEPEDLCIRYDDFLRLLKNVLYVNTALPLLQYKYRPMRLALSKCNWFFEYAQKICFTYPKIGRTEVNIEIAENNCKGKNHLNRK